jgi:hypothetical protein
LYAGHAQCQAHLDGRPRPLALVKSRVDPPRRGHDTGEAGRANSPKNELN